ncbi:E3 ubiquitin-protein ligase ZNF598 [Pancytospora philotis]|nr:E3 ubiquitin-protein ligase ZNF598 [Pancytospora philotis]
MECVVCCEPMELCAEYSCSHTICHKCAAKMIFLYADKACPLCRSAKGKPVFRDAAEAAGAAHGGPSEDDDAVYRGSVVKRRIRSLLLKKCRTCKAVCKDNDELIAHYKEAHAKLLCPVCIHHNHQFWFDHATYTPETLEKHKNGQLGEAGFYGHTYCVHCKQHFYNREEARKHCQMEHQLCTVCDLLGVKCQFYRNFKELEEHYRAKHYCCTDSVCAKNLCYVYAYKSELWTHCLTQHSLEIQLADIQLSARPNPPVCSIGEVEEADPNGLYRQNPNIVTPLINQPYFPSFNSTEAVPSFMDRQILAQSAQAKNSRLQQIRYFTKVFCEEINASIERYIDGIKDFATLKSEIESAVGSQVTLKILETVPFLHRSKEIKDCLVAYRKEVMFPSFTKAPADAKGVGTKRKAANKLPTGFKILDVSKKR